MDNGLKHLDAILEVPYLYTEYCLAIWIEAYGEAIR